MGWSSSEWATRRGELKGAFARVMANKSVMKLVRYPWQSFLSISTIRETIQYRCMALPRYDALWSTISFLTMGLLHRWRLIASVGVGGSEYLAGFGVWLITYIIK